MTELFEHTTPPESTINPWAARLDAIIKILSNDRHPDRVIHDGSEAGTIVPGEPLSDKDRYDFSQMKSFWEDRIRPVGGFTVDVMTAPDAAMPIEDSSEEAA